MDAPGARLRAFSIAIHLTVLGRVFGHRRSWGRPWTHLRTHPERARALERVRNRPKTRLTPVISGDYRAMTTRFSGAVSSVTAAGPHRHAALSAVASGAGDDPSPQHEDVRIVVELRRRSPVDFHTVTSSRFS
jgi:hypothetical protein